MTTDFHTYGRNIFVLRCRHSKGDTWQKIVQSIFSKNKRFSSCFKNREIEFKVQLQPMQPLKTLKLFELSWPPRKQPLNLWLFLVHLQRTLSIFCHQKTLWLGKLSSSKCLGLTRQHRYVIEDNTDTQRMQLHVMSFEVKELPRVGGGVMASTWERWGCSSLYLSDKSIAFGYALRNTYINRTR